MDKKTLIVNFGTLSKCGGIEHTIYARIKYYSSRGVRVIWLKNQRSIIADSYKETLYSQNVEIINVNDNHLYWFKHDNLSFSKEERIVVVSFTIFDMLRSLSLKKEYSDYDVTPVYCIPDTTGKFFFIEQYFRGFLRNVVFKKIRKTILEWDEAGLLTFLAPLQINSLEQNYGFTVNDKERKLVPPLEEPNPLDGELLKQRSRRDGTFNIITVGRFDFPHKGYMLGLIRAYGRLKIKYPQITLTIIGTGKDERLLIEEINKLEEEIRTDVKLLGEVPFDELLKYYKDKHLSVAVASSASDAVRAGVLSLVARNHCEGECEVYGFMPEKMDMTVSKEPGELVDPFIEKAILMSETEYVDKCFEAYEMKKSQAINPWYFFDVAEKSRNYSISPSELRDYIILNYIRKALMFLHISF